MGDILPFEIRKYLKTAGYIYLFIRFSVKWNECLLIKCSRSFSENNELRVQYIQPRKPVQDAYIERFNRIFREDVLDAYLFLNIKEMRKITRDWMQDYNAKSSSSIPGGKRPLKVVTVKNSLPHN